MMLVNLLSMLELAAGSTSNIFSKMCIHTKKAGYALFLSITRRPIFIFLIRALNALNV